MKLQTIIFAFLYSLATQAFALPNSNLNSNDFQKRACPPLTQSFTTPTPHFSFFRAVQTLEYRSQHTAIPLEKRDDAAVSISLDTHTYTHTFPSPTLHTKTWTETHTYTVTVPISSSSAAKTSPPTTAKPTSQPPLTTLSPNTQKPTSQPLPTISPSSSPTTSPTSTTPPTSSTPPKTTTPSISTCTAKARRVRKRKVAS